MRRLFPVLLSGMMAVSFSQLAGAQKVDVQGPAGTGANADLNKSGNTTVAPDVQNSQQIGGGNQSNQQQGNSSTSSQDQSSSSGASSGDKNPASPGKGYAKGHEQGKGNPHRGESASGGASSNSGPNKPGTSEQQTGDTQSRQETPAKPKY